MILHFKPFMPPCKTPQRALMLLGLIVHLTCALGVTGPSGQPAPPAAVAQLDQKAIHDEYVNGNFETVIERITAFQKGNPAHSREDSIFIARHLAVVLAANPKSVEAGKHWMHRLILLSPTADLSGMFVSEEIDRLFERVKQEARVMSGDRGRRKWVWLGAGGTALAVAATAWMLFDGDSGAGKRTVVGVDL
jgi:hypothetical protein